MVDASAPADLVAFVARKTGVDFRAQNADLSSTSHAMKAQRVAMYERYAGGNIDQGWTQFIFDTWEMPVASLKDAELKAGNLNAKFDVIVFPNDNTGTLVGGGRGGGRAGGAPGGGGGRGGGTPPEYITGFGDDGVAALKAFVEGGGTLLTFGAAGGLAMERLGTPVRNVVAGKSSKEFWSPGSTFKVTVDNANPLGYGMPHDAFATWLDGSQAYEITDPNAKVETIVSFIGKDILQSGWLNGEEIIANKAGMVSVPMGSGRIVMIGFRPQRRAQTHGTFKLVFNALMK